MNSCQKKKGEALIAEVDMLLHDDSNFILMVAGAQSGFICNGMEKILIDPYLSDSLTKKIRGYR